CGPVEGRFEGLGHGPGSPVRDRARPAPTGRTRGRGEPCPDSTRPGGRSQAPSALFPTGGGKGQAAGRAEGPQGLRQAASAPANVWRDSAGARDPRPRMGLAQGDPPGVGGQDPGTVWPRGRELVLATQLVDSTSLMGEKFAATVAETVAANSPS